MTESHVCACSAFSGQIELSFESLLLLLRLACLLVPRIKRDGKKKNSSVARPKILSDILSLLPQKTTGAIPPFNRGIYLFSREVFEWNRRVI